MIDSVSTPGVPRAEHFGDHALAVVSVGGKADHLDDDLVVAAGVLGAGIAQQDRLGEGHAVDADVGLAVLLEVGADELMGVALDDLDDLALGIGARDSVFFLSRTSTVSPVAASPACRGRRCRCLWCGRRPALPAGRTNPKPASARRNTPVTR